MIECSTTTFYHIIFCNDNNGVFTAKKEPDASEVISEAWFYVATSFPIFRLKYGIEDAGFKKSWHFQSENGNKYSRWPIKEV